MEHFKTRNQDKFKKISKMKTRQEFQIVNFYTCKENYSKKSFVFLHFFK